VKVTCFRYVIHTHGSFAVLFSVGRMHSLKVVTALLLFFQDKGLIQLGVFNDDVEINLLLFLDLLFSERFGWVSLLLLVLLRKQKHEFLHKLLLLV
jgi:hypothetical protein